MHSDYKLKRQRELKGTYEVEMTCNIPRKSPALANLTVLDTLRMLFTSECKTPLRAL